jgi:hypothetical protein
MKATMQDLKDKYFRVPTRTRPGSPADDGYSRIEPSIFDPTEHKEALILLRAQLEKWEHNVPSRGSRSQSCRSYRNDTDYSHSHSQTSERSRSHRERQPWEFSRRDRSTVPRLCLGQFHPYHPLCPLLDKDLQVIFWFGVWMTTLKIS